MSGIRAFDLFNLAVLSLGFASTSLAQDWKSYYCAAEEKQSIPNQESQCGKPCPENVKVDGLAKAGKDSPADGWYAFTRSMGGLYVSPLRQFQPILVPNTTGIKINDIDISDDGIWILYHDDATKKINFIKKDGSGKYTWDKVCYGVTWYRSSPNGIEIAYATNESNLDAWAAKVDLSGATPKMGAIRQIGKGLGLHYGAGEFEVSKNHIWARMRITANRPFYHAALVFTIPDNGLGMATKSNVYDVKFPFNCGMDISPDGTMLLANLGRAYADCLIDWHAGFHILPVKSHTDPKLNPFDWYLGEGISINWTPRAWRQDANIDFHNNYWSNHRDWIATTDLKGEKGTHLVHWPSNTWYQIAPEKQGLDVYSREPAVYITSAPTSALLPAPEERMGTRHGTLFPEYWRDLLGRKSLGLHNLPGNAPASFLIPEAPGAGK